MKLKLALIAGLLFTSIAAAQEPYPPTFRDYATARGYGNEMKGSRNSQALYNEYRAYAPLPYVVYAVPQYREYPVAYTHRAQCPPRRR